ncbi:hypothetical protein M0811_12679 [Anaeramoeba ignava]|uniref:Uncharacterized protein n=1 Tax=Anaeramoeba ignava TaxID=1746090 RepID=A0A9Q0R6Q5_ANAIG|nr:hypothetical protein M0811_12679 [Anaeramoeba ignava]
MRFPELKWNNPDDLEQGFQYLYLNEGDIKELRVNMFGNDCRRKLHQHTECFTISYVTGRAVVFGSYLVRLGQRGPQIMGANGISHRIGKSLPIHLSSLLQDPIEREIEFIPPNEPYDPVNLLNGAYDQKPKNGSVVV